MGADVLFGYQIPMPVTDLLVPIVSIALLFPAVILTHHLVASVVGSKAKRA